MDVIVRIDGSHRLHEDKRAWEGVAAGKKKTGEIYGVLDAEEIRSHGFDAGRLHEKGLQANPFHDPSWEQNSRGKGSSWESANAWGRAQGESLSAA